MVYENDNEYEQLFGFGGDATRFLSWRSNVILNSSWQK